MEYVYGYVTLTNDDGIDGDVDGGNDDDDIDNSDDDNNNSSCNNYNF